MTGPAPARRPGTRRLAAVVGVATALALTLSACGGGSSAGSDSPVEVVSTSAAANALDGSALDTPLAKPAGTLTDTSGQPYDLATATQGELVLLYFGYTHCPDVCPTTMADVNVALQNVPAQVRLHTKVVFVTTDPDRDTPPVIRSWLDAFSTEFIGLTGPAATVEAMAASVGVSIEPPVTNPDGTISVTHGAQVVAFSPGDGLAHVLYTAGSGADAYEHDLPLLAAGTV